MDRFKGIDVSGMRGVHVIDVGGLETAGAETGVFVGDAEILDAKFTDGGGHPAILLTMIVHAAGLTDFPADGHTFEDCVFKNQVAGVAAFGEEAEFFQGVGLDGVLLDVGLHLFEREVRFRDGGQAGDPVVDGELRDDSVGRHGR